MLYEGIESPGDHAPDDLLRRYDDELSGVLEAVGADRATEAVGAEALEAIKAGEAADLDLREAAAVLALEEGAPDAETILAEVRNRLLLGMTTAVLDVDRVAAGLDADLDPKEVQGRIEGRHPMTLGEYAALHHFIASEAGR